LQPEISHVLMIYSVEGQRIETSVNF